MNVGIIGAGNISDTHARAARAAGLRVVGVFGENRDKARQLAARHEAAVFDTLETLLGHPALDLVMIGSPSGRHAEQARAAARAGRHMLVEKPLDISTARIDALLTEVARAGVTLGVFLQDRLKPAIVSLRQRLNAGEIGRPLLATGTIKWFRPPEYYAMSRWRGTWALDGGGALMNQGIHTVDLMVFLLGPVRRVCGFVATQFHQIEAEDTATAVFEFASGTLGTIEATTAASPAQPRRLEIVGTGGTLVLEGDDLAGTSGAPPENATSPAVSNVTAHERIIVDFVDAVRHGRAPVCDGHEGRRSVEIVEAVYRSARESATVVLRPD